MRTKISAICILTFVLFASICSYAAAKQKGIIVLPSQPSVIEQFAGEELSRCLTVSLGWNIEIKNTRNTGKGNVFYVGSIDKQRMSAAGFPVRQIDRISSKLIDDGVYIKGSKNSVLLIGKGPRGALNAVYDFLENVVGCHWPEPGREYIPKRSDLAFTDIQRKVNPVFPFRGIAIHGACNPQWFGKIVDWLAKNRMNSFQLFPDHYENVRPAVINDILKRGLMPNIGGHSREFYYASHKYFQANPEYFALVNGKRTPSSQICYSEYGSIPDYSANIVAYVKSRPEIQIVSLWPSDGFGFCECDKCKSRQTTDVILDYINRLSESVHKELPSIKTEFLSYIHYTIPPEKIRPLPYVVPTYCEYWSRSQFQPITDNRNENKKLRKEMQTWINDSKQVTIFSYYGDDCIKRYLYNPVPDVVIKDIHYYKKIGLSGNFVLLTNPESWWSNAPHIYAYTRGAWDIKVKADQVNRDYYNSLYGPASLLMKEHANACRSLFNLRTEQGSTGQDILFGMGYAKFDPKKNALTQEQLNSATDKIIECLNRAKESTKDSFARERIRKLTDDAEYVKLLTQIISEYSMFNATHSDQNKQTCISLITRALALDVMKIDDKNGYRSGNDRLVAIARDLIGKDAVWMSANLGDSEDYKKNGIWRWTTEDIVPSSKEKPRRIVIDVTNRVKSNGLYDVKWDYLMGADGLSIISTGLYSGSSKDDIEPVTIDKRDGFTGGGDSVAIYHLELNKYDPSKKYFIVADIYDDREYDTFGQVLMTAN